jgi:hypothetical protein
VLPEHSKTRLYLISAVLALISIAQAYAQAKPENKSSNLVPAAVAPANPASNFSPSAPLPIILPREIAAVPTPQSAKDDWWFIPYIISFLALCVSGIVARYTYKKDLRARRHSIEDDYWLRKVIGPVAIEPLLKSVLEKIGSAPADRASGAFEAEKVKTFHDEFLKKFADLAANVSALSLINAELAASTSEHLDGIQDLMIAYCSSNQLADPTTQVRAIPRKEFQDDARKQLIAMLQGIKTYQMQIV